MAEIHKCGNCERPLVIIAGGQRQNYIFVRGNWLCSKQCFDKWFPNGR